ncbi:ribosomal L7Ae/L30e/S12e/Gadd45 family protein [Aerococcaceae bacterium DSM 111020]|nr:ribosomal L7Ae/L30e/S12e/Gadd45 family protein [Aerococcaceae bacterium DSM 111020]
MNSKQKALNFIGLAQRGSKLISGDERVEKAIKNGQATVIIMANDVSEKTSERYQYLTKAYKKPLVSDFDSYEISQALGKKRSLCCLTDRGMTKKFLSYFAESEVIYDK